MYACMCVGAHVWEAVRVYVHVEAPGWYQEPSSASLDLSIKARSLCQTQCLLTYPGSLARLL